MQKHQILPPLCNWGTRYTKREVIQQRSLRRAELGLSSRLPEQGAALRWAQPGAVPLVSPCGGLSRALCPATHSSSASATLCPQQTPVPKVAVQTASPTSSKESPQGRRRGSSFSFTLQPCRLTLNCCLFSEGWCNSAEGLLCVNLGTGLRAQLKEGGLSLGSLHREERRALNCLRGFSREKQSGKRGRNQS